MDTKTKRTIGTIAATAAVALALTLPGISRLANAPAITVDYSHVVTRPAGVPHIVRHLAGNAGQNTATGWEPRAEHVWVWERHEVDGGFYMNAGTDASQFYCVEPMALFRYEYSDSYWATGKNPCATQSVPNEIDCSGDDGIVPLECID